MRNKTLFTALLFVLSFSIYAQDADDLFAMLEEDDEKTSEPVFATFKTTRLINTYTNETLGKGDLDFRIDHRFAPFSRGYEQMYGFDEIGDMRMAFEYGVTEKLMLGIGRSKGGLMDGFVKYKLLEQTTDNKMPVGLTLFANTGVYINKTDDFGNEFNELAYRYNYTYQAFIARKFNSNFSMVLSPTLMHRNIVLEEDQNDLIALGVGFRYAFTKSSSVIIDYFYNFDSLRAFGNDNGFIPPIGLGYEIETGGHVFQIMLTNTAGINPNRFIPMSYKELDDDTPIGVESLRLAFNISRVF